MASQEIPPNAADSLRAAVYQVCLKYSEYFILHGMEILAMRKIQYLYKV